MTEVHSSRQNAGRGVQVAHTVASFAIACLAVCWLTGCPWSKSNSSSMSGGGGVSTTAEVKPAKGPACLTWEEPALYLVLSGEEHGYLEPCGCSPEQSGGLARRGDLVQRLAAKGVPVVGLNCGGTLKRFREQDKFKFEAMLSGLAVLNYEVVAAGVEELHLGASHLLGLFSEIPDEVDTDPLHPMSRIRRMLVSANVTMFEQPAGILPPKPFRVLNVGNYKVGVTAVLGAGVKDQVVPEGIRNDLTVADPAAVLPDVLAQLKAEQPNFLVLLVHGTEDDALKLAEQFPDFQFVLAAGGPEEPEFEPKNVGSTWVIQTGHKGKHVGVLGYFPSATDEKKFRYELVKLDKRRFQIDPRMEELMRAYQQTLGEQQIVERDDLQITHPSGREYVGAQACGECHKKAYEKWKQSSHAHAYESLLRGPDPAKQPKSAEPTGWSGKTGKSEWISRVHDPECLACHVTGWDSQEMLRYQSGFINEARTPLLAGQQCENCHGPGSAHTELERRAKADAKSVDVEELRTRRLETKLSKETAEKRVCLRCHDNDNSPNFKFKDYWDKVQHPFKD